jgi:hypothetical protein
METYSLFQARPFSFIVLTKEGHGISFQILYANFNYEVAQSRERKRNCENQDGRMLSNSLELKH